MKTFEQLDLIQPVQAALADENYEVPTPIQAQTVPPALLGRDVLGCAQTGTGKTAAFALPILNQLGKNHRKSVPNHPFGLVLAPTRELAIQIGDSFATYGKNLHLRCAVVYGGVNQVRQVRALNRGAHILVATPGRLLDLMNQGYIKLDRLQIFVLDEADRMLDMGFLPDLKRIISQLPEKRQSLFFSATFPSNIAELSKRLLTDPVSVNVTPKKTSVDKIKQRVLFLERAEKLKLLTEMLKGDDVDRSLVFTRTKRGADVLAKKLIRSGIETVAIHGDKSQNARQRALKAFRDRKVNVLVATDVAARGIDIDGISHVVNYDLPDDPESYVHRIGRTGRAGAEGVAITFCLDNQRREWKAIEKLIGISVAGENRTSNSSRFDTKDSESRDADRRPSRRTQTRAAAGDRSRQRRTRNGSSSQGGGNAGQQRRRRAKGRKPGQRVKQA